MINCPDCGTTLSYTVSDDRVDREYKHIFEICHYCGYTKAYVEYANNDTGPVDWSGIEH